MLLFYLNFNLKQVQPDRPENRHFGHGVVIFCYLTPS